MYPGSRVLWGCSAPPAILPRSSQLCGLSFYIQSGKQRKVRWVGDDSHVVFGQEFAGEMGSVRLHCCDARANSFVTKVQGEVFAHFHAVTIKHDSSMWNWLFRLPGRILFEQSPWCQRMWQVCSWIWSSPSSPFLVSVSLYFPCTSHAFFPERLSYHCLGVCHNFSEVCKEFDAVPLLDSSQNRIRPNTRLQIKEHKQISTSTQLRGIVCNDSQDRLVLSSTVASRY
jgi:hypothetical protein